MSLKISSSMWACLSLLSLPGCVAASDPDPAARPGPPARTAGKPPRDAIVSPWQKPQPSPPDLYLAPALAAWTAAGDLVVVDGHSGSTRQTLTTIHLGGTRDLAYDADKARLWVAESDADAPDGEVASHAVTAGAGGPQVGARLFEAAIAGDARLLPSALGTVLFEDVSAGAWRLLGGAGVASAAVSGPPPTSAWLTKELNRTFVRALVYGPSAAELDVAGARLLPGAVAPVTLAPLVIDAGTLPPCARVVPAPARGGALLLDVSGSFLTVRPLSGAVVGAPAQVPLGAVGLRIEAAVSLSGGAVVVALFSGITEVVALEITPQLTIGSLAKVPLAGLTAPTTRFLSHDLVAQGAGRVAAATSAGVFSVRVTTTPTGVHLAVDGGFAGGELRGPLAALP